MMTTKQTIDGVPRKALADFVEYSVHGPYDQRDKWEADKSELRALLDTPAVESELDRMTRRCQNAELALRVQTENYEALKAAQPHGEPVAYRYKEGHASWENENPWVPTTLGHGEVLLGRKELAANGTFKGEERDHYLALVVEPLYTERLAPVAIEHYKNKVKNLKQLLRNVRATLHFSPEDVLAIDAALREDEE